ncbi:MAG: hypothetical protein ABI947_10530, partial [Chloroflexota bacterium]
MVRLFTIKLTMLVLAILLPVGSVSVNAPKSAYVYLFAELPKQSSSPSTIQFKAIDPANPQRQTLINLPGIGTLSPDGKWLAMKSSHGLSFLVTLQLVNLATGQVRMVAEFNSILNDDDIHAYDPGQVFEWSPDSRFLAFNGKLGTKAISGDKWDGDIFVYTPETDQTVQITDSGKMRFQYAWSPDSTRLAVVSADRHCAKSCPVMLEIFEVATQHKLQSAVIYKMEAPGYSAEMLCDLRWSPKMLYLSFLNGCDS